MEVVKVYEDQIVVESANVATEMDTAKSVSVEVQADT